MKERQRRNIIVGIFVIAGIFIFIFAIYLIGKKEYVFGRPYKVCAVFTDVKGLKEGDKVRMSGIDIGTVSSLEFTSYNKVLVQVNIDHEQFSHIKKGSKIVIGSQGLMGAKVVKIIPGDLMGDPVAEYDTLVSIEQIEIDDIIREVNKVSGDIGIVSSELAEITRKINRGDGIFGKLFTDTTISSEVDKSIRNLSEITSNFNDISEKVNQGEGVIGKLFTDTILSSDMNAAGENIDQIAANLKKITDKLNDSTLTSNLYYTTKNLQASTANLVVMTAALNNDSSALNLLIDDPSFADSLEVMIERLNVGIIEATEAAEAVQRSGIIRLGGKKKKE